MGVSRSGRVLVYANEVPWETDVLYSNMYKMVDVSNLAQAVLGGAGTSNATLASGLIASANVTPNLTINIGTGVLYTLSNFDNTAYSSIPADTVDFLYKPFTQVSNFNLAGFNPPGGGVLNYLVQAQGFTDDIDQTNRQFFNPDDPDNPIVQTVKQTRVDGINYSVLSATSPAIPTPTAGWVGLYVVSVAAGQTTITAGNITVYSAAPFITESLTQKISSATGDARYARAIQIQNSSFIYSITSGSANNYILSVSPAVTSYIAGLKVTPLIHLANTGASTININGVGAVSILTNSGASLFSGDLRVGQEAELFYNGSAFVLLNPTGPSAKNFFGSAMFMTAAQTLNATGTPQKLTFDTKTTPGYDPLNWANTTTNLITVPWAGYYRISVSASYFRVGDTAFSIFAFKNGANIKELDHTESTVGSGGAAGTATLLLSAGDTIGVYAFASYSGSPGDATIDVASAADTNFEVVWEGR